MVKQNLSSRAVGWNMESSGRGAIIFISIHYSTLSCIEVGTLITKFCIKDEHTSEAFCED